MRGQVTPFDDSWVTRIDHGDRLPGALGIAFASSQVGGNAGLQFSR